MESREELIYKLDSIIDTETRGETDFDYDDEIEINVSEYKTIENSGYTLTFQTITIGDYTIKANHYTGKMLVDTAEQLRNSINKIGLEKTIETLTRPQDPFDTKIRDLLE